MAEVAQRGFTGGAAALVRRGPAPEPCSGQRDVQQQESPCGCPTLPTGVSWTAVTPKPFSCGERWTPVISPLQVARPESFLPYAGQCWEHTGCPVGGHWGYRCELGHPG